LLKKKKSKNHDKKKRREKKRKEKRDQKQNRDKKKIRVKKNRGKFTNPRVVLNSTEGNWCSSG
jgi:hypothetical protein